MALFQFNNRSIPYHMHLAPFHFDLVLLQSSKATEALWKPILDDFSTRPYAGGRVLTCEWFDPALSNERLAQDFVKLLQTLALVSVRVAAVDDAVAMVGAAQAVQPRLFERTLFFPEGGPVGDDLKRAVRDLCQF